jgi:YidC/Oxa1 family membrane protein insertase
MRLMGAMPVLAAWMLTVTVRIFLIPLTTKQVRSQQAMQRIQPELKRLQAKHKNDRQKLNEEMMKFYKENKVNPLAGCLPILLQAPLFLVLYRLILDLNHRPEPKHLPRSSELFTSLLESGGKMLSWGIDLAESASSVKGLGNALPYYLLIAMTVATGYYQQRQMTSRLPKESINPQMQMIGKVFPAFIGIFSFSIPAGVVVYFIVSNFWQIGQQAITFRKFPLPQSSAGATKDKDVPKHKDAPKETRAGRDGKGNGGSAAPTSGRASGRTAPKGAPTPSSKASKSSKSAKGKRPPPSPRPKGLPASGSKPGPKGTSAKNSRRKDS